MRITETEKKSIINIIKAYDPNALIYLFGSRINNNAKGGDVDILVLSKNISYVDKLNIRISLTDIIMHKIDLIVKETIDSAFVKKAVNEGILLNDR